MAGGVEPLLEGHNLGCYRYTTATVWEGYGAEMRLAPQSHGSLLSRLPRTPLCQDWIRPDRPRERPDVVESSRPYDPAAWRGRMGGLATTHFCLIILVAASYRTLPIGCSILWHRLQSTPTALAFADSIGPIPT